jgi:hypothetical protein
MIHDVAIDRSSEAGPVHEPSALRLVAPALDEACFVEIDWFARYPVAPVAMTFALDVHTALTSRLAAAGYPLDGRVEFAAYSLLWELGRVSATRKHGFLAFGPGGSAYQDLGRALDHLSCSSFPQGPLDPSARLGVPLREFRVLSEYGIGGESGDPSHVTFTTPYMRHLLTSSHLAFLDLGTYRRLSPGIARALYRLLAAEYPEQRVTYPGLELLQRLGSIQRTGSGSRLRQRLDRAHQELVEQDVLLREPDIRKTGGNWHVAYDLDRRRARWLRKTRSLSGEIIGALAGDFGLHDNVALLVRQANAYGVQLEQAVALGRSHSRTLARTLAATALGILWPWKGLPHMVVRYARHGHPIVDRRGRIRPRRSEEGRNTGADYLLRTAVHRRQHLAAASRGPNERPVDWIPNAAARIALELGVGDEPWVREGLEAILLQQHLDLPRYSAP